MICAPCKAGAHELCENAVMLEMFGDGCDCEPCREARAPDPDEGF